MSMNTTNLNQMEKEMIADIQNMFSAWRAQGHLEVAIAGPVQMEDAAGTACKQGVHLERKQPTSVKE